jgi:hypothetical protein
MLLRRAAKAAGIDAYRADRISDYDFRHSAATHVGRSSDNLPGVMYLLGHKQPATTARYMRPQRDTALEVLLAASTAATTPPPAKLSTDSGPIAATDSSPHPSTNPIPPDEILNDYFPVRGGGLEPPWLLTASTSIQSRRENHRKYGSLGSSRSLPAGAAVAA